MPYRELSVIEIKDVLRYWARGESTTAIVRRTGVSRNVSTLSKGVRATRADVDRHHR